MRLLQELNQLHEIWLDSPFFRLEVYQLILAVLLKYDDGTLGCWKSRQRMFCNAYIGIVDGLQNSCPVFEYLYLPYLNNTRRLDLDIQRYFGSLDGTCYSPYPYIVKVLFIIYC